MIASVIIPAYNASATIDQTLRALGAQDFKQPFEVIVVNDGSTDQTARIIAKHPHVTLINQKNAGPACARNTGASHAKGEFLCFTDSDCIPHPDWISLLINGFRDESVAAVCGSYGIANNNSLLARGIHAEIIYRHSHLVPDFPKVFGSYNFCIRKSVFDHLGGFDTKYRNASGEDNDLSYRVNRLDKKIYFERKALVDHYHTTQVVKYLKEQFRHGFWRTAMYADHPQMVKGDSYTFWKDMVEVPISALVVLCLMLVIVGFMTINSFIYFLIFPFLIFEIIFSLIMMKNKFESFYYGFIIFFRAFARTFGLSTGILYFFCTKIKKNFK